MKTVLVAGALALACPVFAQEEAIFSDGAPYERRASRAETREHMIQRLAPQDLHAGEAYLLSPFPYAGHGRGDLATAHAPESELPRMRAGGPGPDLERQWMGRHGEPVRWHPLGEAADRRLDLRIHEEGRWNDNGTCYVYFPLVADVAGEHELVMGSDDGLRLWVNGRLLLSKDVPRGLDPTADRVRAELVEGTNHVLAKVSQGAGGWDYQINLRSAMDPRDEALLDYCLDRDFPPSPEWRSYRRMVYPLPPDIVMEVGGIAFLGDGTPIVCTRRGDVWRVEDAYAEPPLDVRYDLFATGLHEPLGLAVRTVDGVEEVLSVQRAELTRMVDEDGDGSADLYDAFCTGWGVSGNYHEFAFGPKLDAEGNAWVTLNVGFCGSLGKSVVPWRGWCLKVGADGQVTPVCDGLRSPNGIGANLEGEMFYVDNQGDWVGTNRLAHLTPGAWHGHPASKRWRTEEFPGGTEPELYPASVWLPYGRMGQSTADVVLVEDPRFGPFRGQLLVGDQMKATVMRVFLEEVDGFWQGACFPFLSGFQSGVNRLAFAPDGSLLVGETDRGWGSVGKQRFGLERVRFVGPVPFEVLSMRITPDGFELEFTRDVDPRTAADPAAYAMTAHTYEHHASYGSPEMDRGPREITAVELVGPRHVRLTVPDRRPDYVHELELAGVRSAEGAELGHPKAYYTVQRIPARAAGEWKSGFFDGPLKERWRGQLGEWELVSGVRPLADDPRAFEPSPGSGAAWNGARGRTANLVSHEEFGDCEIHVEFCVPEGSNSGVYVQGRYEVQVLDSFGAVEPQHSDCGGIYQRWQDGRGFEGRAPRVNASRAPGEWQSFDIVFRAPRFDASGAKVQNARFEEVRHNGVLVHADVELSGPTRAALPGPEAALGPLMLQGDHGPVAYRSLRVRSLRP